MPCPELLRKPRAVIAAETEIAEILRRLAVEMKSVGAVQVIGAVQVVEHGRGQYHVEIMPGRKR